MATPRSFPAWAGLTILITLGAHTLATCTTFVTIELMHGPSEFARRVRAQDLALLPYYLAVAYTVPSAIAVAYLWPLVDYFRRGCPAPAPAGVQRRALSAPFVVGALGFAAWLGGLVVFPTATLYRFGRWTPDLMSQHVLSPLVNGFLAATTSYLLVDWVFRRRVVPVVLPEGRLPEVSRVVALGVQGRLLVFLVAVAFVPLFTLFGLLRAAAVRLAAGMPVDAVVPSLARASAITFAVFLALGVGLTLALAHTFTGPLGAVAAVLRRVRSGRLDETVAVRSGDEIGVLEDGVNAMVATLQEKERILRTFGRVVEPSVRDRLLAGDLQLGGEVRTATVMFLDLRGFTALAEHTPPTELVATLNEFFTAMTSWVRECGGFVDKFIGDALLVVFGLFTGDAPATQADAAAAAIRCALGARERLARLNTARTAADRPPLAVKIGMHTGPLVAGTIGAQDRHEYTVIGDTVNVAARLQQLCEDHGREVLVSETTYTLAASRGAVGGEVATGEVVALRGREEPVRVLALG